MAGSKMLIAVTDAQIARDLNSKISAARRPVTLCNKTSACDITKSRLSMKNKIETKIAIAIAYRLPKHPRRLVMKIRTLLNPFLHTPYIVGHLSLGSLAY